MYFRRELLDVFDDASTHEQAVLDAEVARARSLEPSLAVVGIAADPPATRALIDASEAPTCSSSAHVASAASRVRPRLGQPPVLTPLALPSRHRAARGHGADQPSPRRARLVAPPSIAPRPKGSGQLERVSDQTPHRIRDGRSDGRGGELSRRCPPDPLAEKRPDRGAERECGDRSDGDRKNDRSRPLVKNHGVVGGRRRARTRRRRRRPPDARSRHRPDRPRVPSGRGVERHRGVRHQDARHRVGVDGRHVAGTVVAASSRRSPTGSRLARLRSHVRRDRRAP